MSIKEMSRIWSESKSRSNRLLLELALADYANDDGICFPSHSTLAKKVRSSKRTVIRMLDEMETAGDLVVRERCGTSNLYVLLAGCDAKEQKRRCAILTPPPAKTSPQAVTGGGDNGSHKTSDDPSVDPLREESGAGAPVGEPAKKPARPQNLVFNAVAKEIFEIPEVALIGEDGGRIGKVVGALKKAEPKVTPEDIEAFRAWYDQEYEGVSRPRDHRKFMEHWMKWRQGGSQSSDMPVYTRAGKAAREAKDNGSTL